MEQYKKAQVIMLPTENKTNLFLSDFNKILNVVNQSSYYHTGQHLYIVNDDEIKEGDWVLSKLNELVLLKKNYTNFNYKKIIATTDKSLNHIKHNESVPYPKGQQIFLPQPSKEWIEYYISEYNKGNCLKEVFVEYEIDYQNDGDSCSEYYWLKINPDNTINIKSAKENWNKNEVIQVLNDCIKDCDSESGFRYDDFEIWIEQNL